MEAMTAKKMALELAALKAAITAHHMKIDKAYEAQAAAEVAFCEVFGFEPWEAPEFAPGWTAAKAVVEALKDESGYFWAWSRVQDLEMMLGKQGEQLRFVTEPTQEWACGYVWILGGETPKASETIAPWVAEVFA